MTVLSSPTVLIVLVSILFLSPPATSKKDVDYTYKYGTFLNDMYDVVAGKFSSVFGRSVLCFVAFLFKTLLPLLTKFVRRK